MGYKKAVVTQFGDSEALKIIEDERIPEPEDHEIRVRVLFSSVNYTDIMIRKGMYPEVKKKPPFTIGYDMVGIIDKLGGHTSGKLKAGQKVAAMTVIGAQSEYVCVPEDELVLLPENIDMKKAVCLILTYVTAYQLLNRIGQVKKGDTILLHGASGAVGTAALQIGSYLGVKIYGTASEKNLEKISRYGGIPIDYNSGDFVKKIRTSETDGLDFVFDPIGGDYTHKSLKTLKKGGKLIGYGFYNAVSGKGGSLFFDFIRLKLLSLVPDGKTVSFYSIGQRKSKFPEQYIEDLNTLFDLLQKGKIDPAIDREISIEEIPMAHKLVESGGLKGKVIVGL